jgi:DNA polymerase III gamma/tau subunit
MEYYKKFRPQKLNEVIGQGAAVKSLAQQFERNAFPHATLLTGPSGTGKTTLGRILRRMLKCAKCDYYEKDCTREKEPLEFVRGLARSSNLAPMGGPCIVWFLEEFQSLSRAGFSQQALLKLLEDTPGHVYFILATTDPDKIHRAIHTRCFEVRLNALKPQDLTALLAKVIEAERLKVSDDVLSEVIDAAEGSARKALVILEQVGSLKSEKDQLEAIKQASFTKEEAIALARLLFNPRSAWIDVAKVLRVLGSQDAEGIRYCILTYARSCMIGKEGGSVPNPKFAGRAYAIIDIFSRNFFDSKHAGLAAACWEVMNAGQ